ncbi:hypothetical protein [Halobacillus halophilus]|nr:hypothetical protein [Halobacillus halophilus]
MPEKLNQHQANGIHEELSNKGVEGMLMFNSNYEVGVFKRLSENNELVMDVGSEEYFLKLNDEEMEDLEQHLMNQENLLIPFHRKTKELILNTEPNYDEEEMEELMNISEGAEDHDEE